MVKLIIGVKGTGKTKNLINDVDDFFQIISSTQFFSFLTDAGEFIGCLYFYNSKRIIFLFN